MHARYRIHDISEIISPALVVFRDLVEDNLGTMLHIAGNPDRLRPHCKTHKTRELTEMQLQRGIHKFKAATMAEAEMLARAGVRDICLSYHIVGPNIRRTVRFLETFPDVQLSVIADHPEPIRQLGETVTAAGQSRPRSLPVLLDINTGQDRTGVSPGDRAVDVYRHLVETPGVEPGGLHVYDGQNHQQDPESRRAAVDRCWGAVLELRDELLRNGWPVPKVVAGGSGSFPIYAEKDDPTLELSPGTCVFWDAGYGEKFPDLPFTPAALLLTRVISRPTSDRVTLDLGYKAVASDPPAGRRMIFPDLPDAEQVLHNEEHLVLQTPRAGEFRPGDELWAIPRHICPTTALHKQVEVVSQGELVDRWDVIARDRWLTL